MYWDHFQRPCMTHKKILSKRNRSYLVILQPLKPVKKSSRLSIHSRRGQNPVLWVSTVVQYHWWPVLSWICSLNGPIHFGGLFAHTLVHTCHQSILKFFNITQVQDNAIVKHSPAFIIGQKRGQKPSEWKLCALKLALVLPIEILFPQFRSFGGNDFDRNWRSLQNQIATDLVSHVLLLIIAN